MAGLSHGIDTNELSRERALRYLIEWRPFRCSVNGWVEAHDAIVQGGQSDSAFDSLWFCRACYEFDERFDFNSQRGRWAQIYAELLLQRVVFQSSPAGDLGLCDALIRAEMSAISLSASGATPEHIDRILQLCPRLQHLDLSWTAATEANIGTAIGHCLNLEYIRLTGTSLGGEVVEALLAAFPHIAIDI